MGNTYGTWLPGDPRGFRTRHHREHVEGDYRFPPPPGFYDDLFESSKARMRRDAIFLPQELRPTVCRLFADALRHHRVEVVELSMGGVHWHLLARFVPVGVDAYEHLEALGVRITHARHVPPVGAGGHWAYDRDPAPRRILGLVRSYITRQVKQMGYFTDAVGGLWAKRPKCEPVTDRAHQLAVVAYIRRHAFQHAAVLSQLEHPT